MRESLIAATSTDGAIGQNNPLVNFGSPPTRRPLSSVTSRPGLYLSLFYVILALVFAVSFWYYYSYDRTEITTLSAEFQPGCQSTAPVPNVLPCQPALIINLLSQNYVYEGTCEGVWNLPPKNPSLLNSCIYNTYAATPGTNNVERDFRFNGLTCSYGHSTSSFRAEAHFLNQRRDNQSINTLNWSLGIFVDTPGPSLWNTSRCAAFYLPCSTGVNFTSLVEEYAMPQLSGESLCECMRRYIPNYKCTQSIRNGLTNTIIKSILNCTTAVSLLHFALPFLTELCRKIHAQATNRKSVSDDEAANVSVK